MYDKLKKIVTKKVWIAFNFDSMSKFHMGKYGGEFCCGLVEGRGAKSVNSTARTPTWEHAQRSTKNDEEQNTKKRNAVYKLFITAQMGLRCVRAS